MVHRLFQVNHLMKYQLMMTPKLNPSYSPYYEWGVENMHQEEFKIWFGENILKNSNDTDADIEEVNLAEYYDHLS